MNRRLIPLLTGSLLVCVAWAAQADVSLTDRQVLRRHMKEARKTAAGTREGRPIMTATGSGALVDASGLEWFLNTDITFSTSSSASGAMSEASYTAAVVATTLSGGTTSSTLNDAFDGYGTLCVSVTGATGPCATGSASYTIYNKNGAPTLEPNGRQTAFNPQTIGTLSVSRKVLVPDNDSFARWLNVVTNNDSVPQTVTLIASNNLGSDSNTRIVTSSNGDAAGDLTDTWITTFQNYSGVTSSDPRLGHVLQGPGARVGLASISFADGDDNPYWAYTFTLAPGQTGIIMNFAVAKPSKAAAAAKAAELVALPPNALQFMSDTEKSQVLNFNVNAAVNGDFDGNGQADLLWRNQATGDLFLWFMNGTTAAQAAAPTPARLADTRWQIRGIADFNGDGYPDLLWHHQTTGDLYVWFMGNGDADAAGNVLPAPTVSVIGASFLTPSRYADTSWQIRGVADFNADGKADILWHNQSTGDLYVWFLGPAVTDLKTGLGPVSPSTVVTGGSFLTPSRFADTRWQIRAVADFNGDSKPDLLWHNQATGDVYAWLMNGTTASAGSYTTPSRVADTRWQIQRVADFNSDGKADILWRHAATGQLYVWYLGPGVVDKARAGDVSAAMVVTGAAFLTPSPMLDANWQIVPR